MAKTLLELLEPKLRISARNPKAGRAIQELLWQRDAIDDRIRVIKEANPITVEEFRRACEEVRAEGGAV